MTTTHVTGTGTYADNAVPALADAKVILGNSNAKFSGVTSTMLQTMQRQRHQVPLRVLGKHHLPDPALAVTFGELARAARKPPAGAGNRVFHARRNDEMIQALLLRAVFGARFRILFTSTAQRHHSAFTRWLMSKMDGIISTCDAAASYLQKPPDIIIPHGIDTSLYCPAPDRAAAWAKTGLPGKRGIGIFGRVRAQKGVDLFVRACIEQLARHPDFTAVVVGQVTRENQGFVNEQKALLDQAGLSARVLFLGEQPFERVPVLMRAMSLVCALSLNEGYGLTVPEAMSSGIPVLASDAGAWPDIVTDNRYGRIVPAGDQDATTAALGELLQQADQLDQMGEAAREHVLRHYDIQTEADALCAYYQRFLEPQSWINPQ